MKIKASKSRGALFNDSNQIIGLTYDDQAFVFEGKSDAGRFVWSGNCLECGAHFGFELSKRDTVTKFVPYRTCPAHRGRQRKQADGNQTGES